MELDDMQALWQGYDAKLDAVLRTSALAVRNRSLDRVETTLGRLARGMLAEIGSSAIVVLLIGGFAAGRIAEWPLGLAGITLFIYAVAILATGIAQFVLLVQIDYDNPVIAIARRLDRLKLLRARVAMWTLSTAPLMWTPLLIVCLRAFFGVDAISAFGWPWIAANLAFGAAVLLSAIAVARRNAPPRAFSSLLRPMINALSGRDVRVAAEQLATLLRYEADVQ